MFDISVSFMKSSEFKIFFTATWYLCRNGMKNRHSLRFNSWKISGTQNELMFLPIVTSNKFRFHIEKSSFKIHPTSPKSIQHVPNLHFLIQLVLGEFSN